VRQAAAGRSLPSLAPQARSPIGHDEYEVGRVLPQIMQWGLSGGDTLTLAQGERWRFSEKLADEGSRAAGIAKTPVIL
jgi:hypothetical protein